MKIKRYLVFIDFLIFIVSSFLSFAIRLETLSLGVYTSACILFTALVVSTKLPLFYLWGLYRKLWRYAGVGELVSIVSAVTLSSVIITIIILWLLVPQGIIQVFPRSVLVIDWLLTIIMTGGIRFFLLLLLRKKSAYNNSCYLKNPPILQKRVLIVGAGEAGNMLLKEIQSNPGLGLIPVGFVDDDPAKHGMQLRNVTVLGPRHRLTDFIRDTMAEEVVVAMPTAPGHVIRETVRMCREAGVRCRTIPGLYELLSGSVKIQQIREVQIEDLLRREPVRIDLEEVGQFFRGARILVTGAGGSIGSELCRQLALLQPELLVLLGHGENSIFSIQSELNQLFPYINAVPVIADIRERVRLEGIFKEFHPSIVFHSAAHKHVPLMENNLVEAITNNIFGTRNVVEVAVDNGVKKFVLISTDKAVNPVSVMGVTKRVAELIIQEMAKRYTAPLVGVRFGNVLGSRGSVIPVFQKQIIAGGPVTVTDPEVCRFFMSIPEATQLVLQAAAVGAGGEIFVLDMGEPVRILDLAQDLIRLHGLEPDRDMEIVFTGLRPGEKLCEELFFPWEKPERTKHPKILMVNSNRGINQEQLYNTLSELEHLTRNGDVKGILVKLKALVPQFEPSGIS